MSAIYKVNFNNLKGKLDELENEYSNFSNTAYKTYLDSYLKTFGGSTLISGMKNSLDNLYSDVNNGYKKIIKWLKDYYEISNNIENVLSKSASLGSISDDSIRNYIDSKLLNIEDDALRYTSIPKLDKKCFNFNTVHAVGNSYKESKKSYDKNKITKSSMLQHKSKNPYWLNNHLMDEYNNEKSALEDKFASFIIQNERAISKIKSTKELGFKSNYTEQELTKYILENPEYFKNLLSSEEFKNIVGMSFEEYLEKLDMYDYQIATCKASIYSLKQQEKQSEYVEFMQSQEFLNFKSTISVEEAKNYCLTNLKNIGIDTLTSIGYLSDEEFLLFTYLYQNEGKTSAKKFIDAYEDKINQTKGKVEADTYISKIIDETAFSNFIISKSKELDSSEKLKDEISKKFNETDQKSLLEINNYLVNSYIDAGISKEILTTNDKNSALAIIQNYASLKNNYGDTIANAYIENIEQCLNDCSLTLNISIKDGAQKYFTTFGKGFENGIISFFEGFENIFEIEGMISDNQYTQMYIASYLNGKTSLNIDYQVSTSVGNMTPTVILATLTGGQAAGVVTSLNFASQYGNTLNQGLIDGNGYIGSMANATIVAGSESALEALAGGINALRISGKTTEVIEDVAINSFKDSLNYSLKNFVKNFLPNAFKEGAEEFAQTYIEAESNKIFFDKTIDLSIVTKEALYSGMLGAFTASIINSATFTTSLAQNVVVQGINRGIEIGAGIQFDNEIINGNIDLSKYNNIDEAFNDYITNNPDVINFSSLKQTLNKFGSEFVDKIKQNTDNIKENTTRFSTDNGGFVNLDGFTHGNIKNTVESNSKNVNSNVEQQIAEANYYIEKGTLLSKTIKANNISEITPELLLKINDPSVVNFEVDGKRYSYIDMKQELGMISKSSVDIKEIINNPNNSLAIKGENSYNYVNSKVKTVFNENINLGKSFLGLLLTPLTLITRFKNDSVLTNPDICNKIVNEGIYHFTSEQVAHKILESGYVKESNPMISYGKKKSFFFAGIPEFQDLAVNLNQLETKRVAVKIRVDESNLSDFNYRSMTDNALSHNGNYNFDSSKAEIVYLGLFEESGKLVYKEMPKTNWDSYKCDVNSSKISNTYANIGSYLIALGKEVEVFSNSMNKIQNNILNMTSKIKVNDNFKALANKNFKVQRFLKNIDTAESKITDMNGIKIDNVSSISSKQVSEKNVNSNNKIGFSFFNKKTNNYNYDSMIDNIIQIMDSKYGTGIGIKQLQNYLETNNLNNITCTDGARDMIQKIPIEHIQKYLSNLNKVDKNIELNNFFEIHKVENYGVDQAAIENLCIYELNGQQFDYRTAKKIVNDAKNNMQVIPHFKKIGNNQYSYLKNKLNNMGFSNSEASIIMSSINDASACSYASVCNNIYYLFRNSEAYFENVFGYKMYKPNGEFNFEELLLDLYVFANLENNGGHFLKQNPFNGKCYINQQYLGDTIDVFGRQIFKSNMQEYMSDSLNGKNNQIIDKFLKSKDPKLSYESKFLFDNFSAKTYSKKNRQSIISNLIDLLNSGEYALDMNYYSNGKEITAISYDRNSYADQSTLNWNEKGGHSVAITGIADSGFVVSSWGNKYFIPYDNLFNGGSFQIGVSSIKYKR